MVTNRRGAGTLGCLFSIFIVVAIGYFATHFGEAYLRAYRFEDAMQGELKVAGTKGNDEIIARLHMVADTLEIPEEGHAIVIVRSGRNIAIWADYIEAVEFPFGIRNLHLKPHAFGRISGDAPSGQR